MYKCCECGLVFDKPKQYGEDCTPYGGPAEPGFTQYYYVCPACKGSYEEALVCPHCEDAYVGVSSSYPFCAKCQHDIINEYKQLMNNTFREDEYDMIMDHIDSINPYDKKGE